MTANSEKPKIKENPEESSDKEDILNENTEERQTGAGETAEGLTTLKSGKVQELYKSTIEGLEVDEKSDITTLNKSVEAVRYNIKLLEGDKNTDKIDSVKKETARRIRAYTTGITDDWYTLNYSKVGSDKKSMSHEHYIGLGDILLDPSIKEVLIQKDGQIIHAERGVVAEGKHKGRLGFVDKSTKKYVATHDNDKFKILSNTEIAEKNVFLKLLDEETLTRTEHQKNFQKEVENEQSDELNLYESHIDPNRGIVEQMQLSLSNAQRANAQIIVDEFKKHNFPDNLIAAAIINAYKESGLKNINPGDSGHSIGLFQLYDQGGAGDGMSVEDRENPVLNTKRIIEVVNGGFGKTLRARANAGASIDELTYLFGRYIENPYSNNPSKREAVCKQRGAFARSVFPTKLIDSLPETFEVAGLKVKNTLEKDKPAILGSSTAYGMEAQSKNVLGIVGIGPEAFLANLKKWWPILEKNKPSKVTIVGLAINGLTSNSSNIENSVERNMQAYDEIVDFLHSKDIADVKIATLQPYKTKITAIKAFNEALRHSKHKDNLIDIAKEITTEDGLAWKGGMSANDDLHMSTQAKAILQNLHANA